jgi:hypothetical protein
MNDRNDDIDITQGIKVAGESLTVPALDLTEALQRANIRRSRRARGLLTAASAVVTVALVIALVHVTSNSAGPAIAVVTSPTLASSPGLMAPSNCFGPDVFVSPSGDVSLTAAAPQALSFKLTESDTSHGILIEGSLVLSKPGTGYSDPSPLDANGVPRFTLPENQISSMKVVPTSGHFSDALSVSGLAPGIYPVTFIGVFNPGADCNGPKAPWTTIFTVGTVTVH